MHFFAQIICIGMGCVIEAILWILNLTTGETGIQEGSPVSEGRGRTGSDSESNQQIIATTGEGKVMESRTRQSAFWNNQRNNYNGRTNKEVVFSRQVLDDIRLNAGRYPAETGGLLASTSDTKIIDKCYFDVHSRNTPGTFYYDVESMSAIFREWKAEGYITDGIYHSHPRGYIQPSYHDISTALLHIRFFKIEYFYLPILQPDRRGLFKMYFYVVRVDGDNLTVTLEYVIGARENGYVYEPFMAWKQVYSIKALDDYRRSIDHREASKETEKEQTIRTATAYTTVKVAAASCNGKVQLLPEKAVAGISDTATVTPVSAVNERTENSSDNFVAGDTKGMDQDVAAKYADAEKVRIPVANTEGNDNTEGKPEVYMASTKDTPGIGTLGRNAQCPAEGESRKNQSLEYGKCPDQSKEEKEMRTISKHNIPISEYFRKVDSLYPESVLDKVIVCIGTGGARSFLINLARCGFRNFLLMDADVVSPSNIATQDVFISEMGRYKVDVIGERIKDINPDANVICIHDFLDDEVSDEDFKCYMDRFPDKKPTDFLILGCTDNFEAQKRSSLLALKYGTPYLAAMMYEAGAAAEIIFVYPGVTESCPRCLLRDRFEKYEHGFKNEVTSAECTIFATEYMNAVKGYIALMLLSYHEGTNCPFSTMLDEVKDRNFVEIRLNPHLCNSSLGITLFDKVFAEASRYTYMGETIWVPQHPDRPEFGSEPCRLCGGTGDLKKLQTEWSNVDTRSIDFSEKTTEDAQSRVNANSEMTDDNTKQGYHLDISA